MERMEESCALYRLRGWKLLGILENDRYHAAGTRARFSHRALGLIINWRTAIGAGCVSS